MDLQAISKESGKLIPAGLVELRKSDPDNLMETGEAKFIKPLLTPGLWKHT